MAASVPSGMDVPLFYSGGASLSGSSAFLRPLSPPCLPPPRGPSGSSVTLLADRAADGTSGSGTQRLSFDLLREKVSVNPVSFSACPLPATAQSLPGAQEGGTAQAAPGVVGYIRLTTFNQNSAGAKRQTYILR